MRASDKGNEALRVWHASGQRTGSPTQETTRLKVRDDELRFRELSYQGEFQISRERNPVFPIGTGQATNAALAYAATYCSI